MASIDISRVTYHIYNECLDSADNFGNDNGITDSLEEAKTAVEVFLFHKSRGSSGGYIGAPVEDFIAFLELRGFSLKGIKFSCTPWDKSRSGTIDLGNVDPLVCTSKVEASIQNIGRRIDIKEYRMVIGKLIETYPNIDPMMIYQMFYASAPQKRPETIDLRPYELLSVKDSLDREKAAQYFKDKGIFEEFEDKRAEILIAEITGHSLGKDINRRLMALIDGSRFVNFGGLTDNGLAMLKSKDALYAEAKRILASADVTANLEVLEQIPLEDYFKVGLFIGLPDRKGTANVMLTWAAASAGNTVSRTISQHIFSDNNIFDRLAKEKIGRVEGYSRKRQLLDLIYARAAANPDSVPENVIYFLLHGLSDLGSSLDRPFYHSAIDALKLLGNRVTPLLKEGLADDSIEVKKNTCDLIEFIFGGKMKDLPDDFIPLLIENLGAIPYHLDLVAGTHTLFEDTKRGIEIVQQTAKILLDIGDRGVPALREALKSKDKSIAELARQILQQIKKK